MSEQATKTIDEISKILAKTEWNNDTLEQVNDCLLRNGFTEHVNDNLWSNKYLRAQLEDELVDALTQTLDIWHEQLGFDLWDVTIRGFVASIITSMRDIYITQEKQ